VTGGSGAFDHCELVNSRLVSSGDVLHRPCAAGPSPGTDVPGCGQRWGKSSRDVAP
jgi:hypothetical protein